MKLLAKTSIIYFFSTTLVFLIGGLIFYHNLRKIVDEEATEKIYDEKEMIEQFVKENNRIPVSEIMTGDIIYFNQQINQTKESYSDTLIYSKKEDELLPYRTLRFPITVGGKNYRVSISKALFESDDLIETILYSFIGLTLVLLISTLVMNRIVSKRLWKPFFNSIEELNKYKIDKHEPLHFNKTSTVEFKTLNDALAKMTNKISADYNNLKAFTENASHELQTPLSLIMTSAELLLQEKNLSEKQSETILIIQQTARKMSKLNQTLLLLAKIENRQFENKEEINISQLLLSKLELYNELIAHKEITLEQNIQADVLLKIHPILVDVMISNLITNAIRHNFKGGKITVGLEKSKLTICNSGTELRSIEKLFDRFYKENTSSESTGLGLALVKQIVDTTGMKLQYSYKNMQHSFEIHF